MIPLRLHSDFSLLKAMVSVEEYCDVLKSMGYSGAALTDFDSGFGWLDYYMQMKKAGLKGILGASLQINLLSSLQFDPKIRQKGVLSFLVLNEEGYRNLSLILSAYSLQTLSLDRLIELQKGLVVLVSPDHPQLADAEAFYARWNRENLFFEVHRYEGAKNEDLAVRMAEKFGRVVATQPTYYLKREDALAHEVMLSIGAATTLLEEDRPKLPSDQFFLRSPDEMSALFYDHPEWLEVSDQIFKRVDFSWKSGTYHIPKYGDGDSKNIDSKLYEECQKGLERRLELIRVHTPAEKFEETRRIYKERLEEEYQIICKMRFSDYFLVVADFIQWSKANHIPVGPGRGSGAGSLAAYCLSIVDIDPVRYNLLFERFLNPERVSMPDFDVDFCIKGRERVIQYVRDKYNLKVEEGRPIEEFLKVAQIITFGKMKSKAVIRDVGRALGIPYSDVDAIAKMVPNVLNITLKEAFEMEPGFGQLRARDPKADQLLSIAERLEGLNRHASVHAAGVVIADDVITKYVPLYRGSDNEIVTQFEMKGIEKIGLLKFDFLGLRNLTVIQECIQLTGQDIDLLKIDYNDPKVMSELSTGDTMGVFQLESSGMRDVIRRLRPSCLEDIIAIVALYRPGPIEGGMIDDFILRKQGKKEIAYDSPVLEPILRETYGVFVYQEQVMKTANVMAGYSLGEADLLRRAMGKKIASEMAEQRERFVQGAIAKKHPEALATKIFDLMSKFAEYGFNKSHAAAYAMVTVQTAYLKTYYPEAFYAALLSSESEDLEKIGMIIRNATSRGIDVLPPHVNFSKVDFSLEKAEDKTCIRYGLSAIKNLGEAAATSIENERERGGPFKNPEDFFMRLPMDQMNRRAFECLIRSGALDGLGATRSTMMGSLDSLISSAQAHGKAKAGGQMALFSAKPKLKAVDEFPDRIRLSDEKQLLGTYISGHPLKSFEPLLQSFKTRSISDVLEKPAPPRDVEVVIAGLVVSFKEILTKKGTKMAFFTIEDWDAQMEIVVFSDLYQRKGALIGGDRLLLVRGQVVKENDTTRMLAREISDLSNVEFSELHLKLKSSDHVERLQGFPERARKYPGSIKVKVHIPVEGEVSGASLKHSHVTMEPSFTIQVHPELVAWMETEFGVGSVQLQ